MLIGKLVSHPCGNRAVQGCAACQRPMCDRHLDAAAPRRCLQCAGVYAPPAAPLQVSEQEMMSFDAAELAAFDRDEPAPGQAPFHGD